MLLCADVPLRNYSLTHPIMGSGCWTWTEKRLEDQGSDKLTLLGRLQMLKAQRTRTRYWRTASGNGNPISHGHFMGMDTVYSAGTGTGMGISELE